MTYQDAVAYLESFVNYEHQRDPHAMRAVKLERMRRLCQRLGDPQRRFRSILVTGTNGKGSICAMLYAMLRESSLRAGLYTSPHLEQVRERIRVAEPKDVSTPSLSFSQEAHPDTETATDLAHGQDWIREEELAEIVAQIQPVLEQLHRESPQSPPTYFEVLTAVAFVYFHRRQVDVAVLEVGLGGRLDATNVVEQAVSIIAPVDVDHTDILGDTPAHIAEEKAGIIKPHQTVITAIQSSDVMEVLHTACETQGVPLVVCGQDLTVRIRHHGLNGLDLSVTGQRGIYDALHLPLLGRHQAQNAAIAVGAFEALSNLGIPYSLVERGLAQVEWPGRLEVVNDEPLILMDGAHNAHAAAALAQTLKELCDGRKIHLLIGMSWDKPVEEVGTLLGPLSVGVTCTKSHHPRALDATELAKRLAPLCPDVHVMSEPADAYTYLLNAVSPRDVIVVTGSLFLVGELRAAIRRSYLRAKRTLRPDAAVQETAA